MDCTIDEADLARALPTVLTHVHDRGDRYTVVRNGRAVARIEPVAPPVGIMPSELVARLGDLRVPEGFADDLEAIKRAQPPPEFPEWDR